MTQWLTHAVTCCHLLAIFILYGTNIHIFKNVLIFYISYISIYNILYYHQPFERITWVNDSMTHSCSDLLPPTGHFHFIWNKYSYFYQCIIYGCFFSPSFLIILKYQYSTFLLFKHQNIIYAFVTAFMSCIKCLNASKHTSDADSVPPLHCK